MIYCGAFHSQEGTEAREILVLHEIGMQAFEPLTQPLDGSRMPKVDYRGWAMRNVRQQRHNVVCRYGYPEQTSISRSQPKIYPLDAQQLRAASTFSSLPMDGFWLR